MLKPDSFWDRAGQNFPLGLGGFFPGPKTTDEYSSASYPGIKIRVTPVEQDGKKVLQAQLVNEVGTPVAKHTPFVSGDPNAIKNFIKDYMGLNDVILKKNADQPAEPAAKTPIVSSAAELKNWTKDNTYNVGGAIYYFDTTSGQWKKK